MIALSHVDLQKLHTLSAPSIADNLLILEDISEISALNRDDVILGGGSNIIFLPHVKERLVKFNFSGISIQEETKDTVIIEALAGTKWHEFVEFCCENSLFGAENLTLIHGTVGAAPVQNIGAFGVEISDFLLEVHVYDRQNKDFFILNLNDCNFSYRNSIFKKKPYWSVLKIRCQLAKNGALKRNYGDLKNTPAKNPREMMEQIIALREARLPNPSVLPNAGSFFHNPILEASDFQRLQAKFPEIPSFGVINSSNVKIPAAWLIEKAGFKGVRDGNVGIYEKHALILVNFGGNGCEIIQFANVIQQDIFKRFSVQLTIEPSIIGVA